MLMSIGLRTAASLGRGTGCRFRASLRGRSRPGAPPATCPCAGLCLGRRPPRQRPIGCRLATRSRVDACVEGANARPRGRRVRAASDRRPLPLWRLVAKHRLRLLGSRLRGLPLDRQADPSLELGAAARGSADSVRRSPCRRSPVHGGRGPRSACRLEAHRHFGAADRRARHLRPAGEAPRTFRRRAEAPELADRSHHSTIGRTSTAPPIGVDGIRPANSSAVSMSSASKMR